VLARNGLVEAERRLQKEYSTFGWNGPDELIQADITYFNGVPLMTMEDDHSRNGWATSMIDQTDERVVHAMKTLHPDKYENLLTDNGSQFQEKLQDEKVLRKQHKWKTHMDFSSSPTDHGQNVKHAEGIEEVPKAQAWKEH